MKQNHAELPMVDILIDGKRMRLMSEDAAVQLMVAIISLKYKQGQENNSIINRKS